MNVNPSVSWKLSRLRRVFSNILHPPQHHKPRNAVLTKAEKKRADACHASGDDVLHCSIRQKIGRLELPEQLLGAKFLRLEHPAQDVPGQRHRRQDGPPLQWQQIDMLSHGDPITGSEEVQRMNCSAPEGQGKVQGQVRGESLPATPLTVQLRQKERITLARL